MPTKKPRNCGKLGVLPLKGVIRTLPVRVPARAVDEPAMPSFMRRALDHVSTFFTRVVAK